MEGGKEEIPTTSQATTGTEASGRPSLAERLMNPPPPGARTSGHASPRTLAAQPTAELPRPSGHTNRQETVRETIARGSALTGKHWGPSLAANIALRDARRFVRVRYFSFLASMLILLVTLVVSTIVLSVSLLSDGRWEEQAAAGSIAGAALLLLLFLQYNPASGFASAAAELGQLEALGSHLERSYALWDAFLEDRESKQQITANEVALAVSSMTAATRELVAAQTEFVALRRSRGDERPPRPSFPSSTTPDPRRY